MSLIDYVGRQIRQLRENFNGSGISQEKLASSLGIAPNTVSRWETGIYKPSLEDLDNLSRFFGVSMLEFFPREQPTPDEKVAALLRATEGLQPEDIEELRRYAEFRKARHIYDGGKRPARGRKRGTSANTSAVLSENAATR